MRFRHVNTVDSSVSTWLTQCNDDTLRHDNIVYTPPSYLGWSDDAMCYGTPFAIGMRFRHVNQVYSNTVNRCNVVRYLLSMTHYVIMFASNVVIHRGIDSALGGC